MEKGTVEKGTWTQQRQTKLGLVTITIVEVQDLYEVSVSFVNDSSNLKFQVSETFGDTRAAFFWAYGLKQAINDDWAGFTREGNTLVASHPKKGKKPEIYVIEQAIESIRHEYDTFVLGRTSTSKGDTISTSEVKASSLSPEDQKTLLALMARAKGKIETVKHE